MTYFLVRLQYPKPGGRRASCAGCVRKGSPQVAVPPPARLPAIIHANAAAAQSSNKKCNATPTDGEAQKGGEGANRTNQRPPPPPSRSLTNEEPPSKQYLQ